MNISTKELLIHNPQAFLKLDRFLVVAMLEREFAIILNKTNIGAAIQYSCTSYRWGEHLGANICLVIGLNKLEIILHQNDNMLTLTKHSTFL